MGDFAPLTPIIVKDIMQRLSINAQYIIVVINKPVPIFILTPLFFPNFVLKKIESAFNLKSSVNIPDTRNDMPIININE